MKELNVGTNQALHSIPIRSRNRYQVEPTTCSLRLQKDVYQMEVSDHGDHDLVIRSEFKTIQVLFSPSSHAYTQQQDFRFFLLSLSYHYFCFCCYLCIFILI